MGLVVCSMRVTSLVLIQDSTPIFKTGNSLLSSRSVRSSSDQYTLAKGKPTSLCADKSVYWSSIAEIFMYTFVFGGLALLMNFKVHDPLPRFVGVFLFLGIYFLLLFVQHRTAIHPLRILRARGFTLGDTYILINPDEDNTALLKKIEGQKKQSTFLIELPQS